jgi:hypothetical protein
VKRGVLTKSAAAKQLTSGSKSQWALSSDIEEQRDEEGHVYYTDPQNGATAWDWQELSNARCVRGCVLLLIVVVLSVLVCIGLWLLWMYL